jgi:hypothetical protein
MRILCSAPALSFSEQRLGFVDQRFVSPVGRNLVQRLFGAAVQRLDA